MTTDIKLDQAGGTWIVAEAAAFKTTASDVIVDSETRRGGAGGPFRRAIVHGPGDTLVLNYAGDYTGGTATHGSLTAQGPLVANGDVTVTATLRLRDPELSPQTEVPDVQRLLSSLVAFADDARRRLDLLEDRLARLTQFVGAAEVPAWISRTEVEEGDDMGLVRPSAAELGLTVEYVALQREPGFGHEDVVRIDPPAGTLVPRGATVQVTINLQG